MAFSYRDVLDQYDAQHDTGATEDTLPDWSRKMNELTGTDLYSAGYHDNWVKRASVGIDRLLEKTGAPQLGEQVGRAVGQPFGWEESLGAIGHGLPRMAVNLAPMSLLGGFGVPGKIIGGALTAGLAGAETYTATDSPLAGALSGGAFVAMPYAARFGEQLALRGAGAKLVGGPLADLTTGEVTGNVPFHYAADKWTPQWLAGQAGQQLGVGATIATQHLGTELATGQPLTNPFTPENLTGIALSTLPFAGVHAAEGGINRLLGEPRAMRPSELESALKLSKIAIDAKDQREAQASTEQAPGVTKQPASTEETPPIVAAETAAMLESLRKNQLTIQNDPNMTPDEKYAEMNKLLQREGEVTQQHVPVGSTIFGNAPTSRTEVRTDVIGQQLRINGPKTWRVIYVSDDPRNPEELRGKIVGYSTLNEPPPRFGLQSVETGTGYGTTARWSLPDSQWWSWVKTPEEYARGGRMPQMAGFGETRPVTQVPQEQLLGGLPQQPERTRAQISDQMNELKTIHDAAVAAQTTAELQQGVIGINAIQAEHNLPLTTDTELRTTMARLIDLGKDPMDAAKEAVKVHAKNTSQQIKKIMDGIEEAGLSPSEERQEAANVSALMGRSADDLGNAGFSIVDSSHFSKGSSEVQNGEQELADMVNSDAISAVRQPAVQEAYDKGGGYAEGWNLAEDAHDFLSLVNHFGGLENVKADLPKAADLLSERFAGKMTLDPEDVTDFLNRPHVQEMFRALDMTMSQRLNVNKTLQHIMVRPAGNRFLFSMLKFDPETNKLGRYDVAKDGWMNEQRFLKTGGLTGPLNKTEVDLYRLIAPDAFREGEVNIPMLDKALNESNVIETKSLSGPTISEGRVNTEQTVRDTMNELQHYIETAGYAIETGYDADETYIRHREADPMSVIEHDSPEYQQIPANVRNWFEQYGQLRYRLSEEPQTLRGVQYPFIAPKPESQMPGYTELLVRIPFKGGTPLQVPKASKGEKGILYSGPHFGAEDQNVVASVRGYMETLPNGEKAFHVIEVQSDWAQRQRNLQKEAELRVEQIPSTDPDNGGRWFVKQYGGESTFETKEEAVNDFVKKQPTHPLLDVYNNLALKAAIQHAKDAGATKLILSDAETAMMTEGHDRQVKTTFTTTVDHPEEALRKVMDVTGIPAQIRGNEIVDLPYKGNTLADLVKRPDGKTEVVIGGPSLALYHDTAKLESAGFTHERAAPSQEKGMRLNYDEILPNIASKLTGDKGERVNLGRHKETGVRLTPEETDAANAQIDLVDQRLNRGEIDMAERQRLVNEIHRQTDEGKEIVGSPTFKEPNGQPKTSVTGRSYDISGLPSEFTLTEPSRTGIRVPQRYIPAPEEQQQAAKLGVNRGGHGMAQYLANHEDPFYNAFGKDIIRNFPQLLNRIGGSFRLISGGGQARASAGDRFELEFNPGLLGSDSLTQAQVIAHELTHGLSLAALRDPANAHIAVELTDLRARLVEQLPREMRRAYDKAIEGDWLGKFQRDEITNFNSLFPKGTESQRDILYGLLHNDELITQGFTNPAMRDFMRSVKTAEGQTWFSRFTNVIRSLLRLGQGVDGTAFEEFMSHTDRLLSRGEFVSDFRNFADRYFSNLGFREGHTNQSTNRATGLVMGLDKFSTPESILDSIRQTAGPVRSPEWVRANKELVGMFQERGPDAAATLETLAELGHKAGTPGMADLAHEMMLGETPDMERALQVLPEAAVNYVYSVMRDARSILGAVDAGLARNKGVLNVRDAEMVREPVNQLLNFMDRLGDLEGEHQKAVRSIQNLFNMTPTGYADSVTANPVKFPVWAHDEPKQSLFQWIARFLEPPGQTARRIPEWAEAISRMWQMVPNQHKMAGESRKPFGMDLTTMELDKDTVKATSKILSQPKLTSAADRWIGLTQGEGKKNGKVVPLDKDHPEVQKILSGLSQQERDDVDTIMHQRMLSNQAMQNQILEAQLKNASTMGAALVQKDMPQTKMADAVKLSGQMMEALTGNLEDPAFKQQSDAAIASLQQALTPEAFNTLLKYSMKAASHWKEQQTFMNDNPDWANGRRYGKFLVTYKKGGKAYLDGVNSMKEALSLAGEKRNIVKFEKNEKDAEDMPPYLGMDAPGVIDRLRQLEQDQREILIGKGVITREEAENLKKYSPAEQLATEETYRRGVPGLTPEPRGLTKMREDYPWLRNHFAWVEKTANYWTRQTLRTDVNFMLKSPEFASNPELKSYIEDYANNILKPDARFGKLAQRLATTWFLGFSPAAAMVNATQPFLTHIAELTAMSGKPIASYGRVLSSMKELIQHGITGNWGSEEHARAMHQWTREAEVGIGMYDDQAAAQESIATNHMRVMNKQRVQTMGEKLSTLVGNYSTASMWMFKGVERLNNQMALLSGFDHYRSQGLSYDEAYEKAKEFNRSVNYGGGPLQRPVGLYKALPRNIAMLATSMQSYVLGTTWQLARYIKQGFFRPEGLKPSEVYAAKTAAVQMLATQLAAAGVLGLPFVSGAIAALDKAFPGLEVNRHLRDWMNKLLGQDGENGSTLTDMAMTGVPSMFGWDLQSRLSMGNTLPGVSEVNGFEPERLLGPPASLIGQWIKGGQKLIQGDPKGVDNLMPNALTKIERLLRSGGQVLDYRDRPIYTPTTGDIVGMTLGFQPKKLSDFNAAASIAKQAQDNVTAREGEFHQRQAEDILKGNFGSVRNALLQRAAEDKTYDPRAGARSISSAAADLTYPRDLRNEGSLRGADVRSKLLSTFNLPTTQPSETDRLQFQNQVQRRLGLVAAPSSTDLRQAQLVDDLRRQYPTLTRSELRRQASRLLHAPRLQTLASPVE